MPPKHNGILGTASETTAQQDCDTRHQSQQLPQQHLKSEFPSVLCPYSIPVCPGCFGERSEPGNVTVTKAGKGLKDHGVPAVPDPLPVPSPEHSVPPPGVPGTLQGWHSTLHWCPETLPCPLTSEPWLWGQVSHTEFQTGNEHCIQVFHQEAAAALI